MTVIPAIRLRRPSKDVFRVKTRPDLPPNLHPARIGGRRRRMPAIPLPGSDRLGKTECRGDRCPLDIRSQESRGSVRGDRRSSAERRPTACPTRASGRSSAEDRTGTGGWRSPSGLVFNREGACRSANRTYIRRIAGNLKRFRSFSPAHQSLYFRGRPSGTDPSLVGQMEPRR